MKGFFKFLLLFIIPFASCKKDTETDSNGNIIVKGSIKLEVSVKHHTWPVGGISVYLKKDATTWPGKDTTQYNFRTTTYASGDAIFENLFPGNYYVYAAGFDPTDGHNVIGYHDIVLDTSTVSNNEAYFMLLVSE